MDAALADARYLSFSSAGTHGAAYVGALDALEAHMGEDYAAWRGRIGCGQPSAPNTQIRVPRGIGLSSFPSCAEMHL